MSYGQIALAWLLIGTCLLLILVILLQRGRGGGLAGAFGGGGGSSAFGAKTGDVFTWITVGLAGFFVTLAVVANFVFEPEVLASAIAAEIAPADSPVPTPIGADQGIGKIELLTSDGQIIPVETKIVGEPAIEKTAQPEGGPPESDSEAGGGETSGGEKPESSDQGGSAADDEGDEGPGN